ncbi:hypothetical protein N9N28_14880 [Rubripirellula amarantea]|uniref:Endonuclease/Exonuclease/phosphatase family protein n=1 Tax=Rubripirellula amarantea TaxID=2527999 RepID=A0A5C5WIN5_9BACT|nr:endonuclease/exonuclease/phosphatase family protein [Rubripirellula amarantea]MDA8745911.1 hypothetical protein [Rubripirellula amarantea]TWT50686.1 Endonuclease/Exonuclease/phosphatase family protein [Rubripirellula amarantea]
MKLALPLLILAVLFTTRVAAEETSATHKTPIRILSWNIESEGADIHVIAKQLAEMPRYDIYGLTEVKAEEWQAIKEALGDDYDYWYSRTGFNDRTAYIVKKDRFEILSRGELGSFDGIIINPGNYRSAHVYELYDRLNKTVFTVVLNHLARGKAEVRQQQAEGLRRWASALNRPIIAIGDYNFDYVFATEQGNRAFDVFAQDGTFEWVKPNPLVDSNWFDGNGDGEDDYPGSILDFAFVAGEAKHWHPTSRVIVRDGDFPDDKTTSDHRPLELVLAP